MQPDDRTEATNPQNLRRLSRREFVRTLGEATAAGGLVSAALGGYALTSSQRAEAAEAILHGLGDLPKAKLGSKMGGMEVTRIVISQDWSPDLVEAGLAKGINFIHKAGYWSRNGGLPDAVKKLPRESYFVDTTVDNTPRFPDNEDQAYNQVNHELEVTGLKYVDIFRAHFGWHTLDSFNKGQNASYRAFQRLKREGKAKYFGVSQHAAPREDYETYMTMIQAQIDSGVIDSIQCWLNYSTTPEELAMFEKARRAGIGITAMKTVAYGGDKMRADAAKQAELKAPGMIGRACIRYSLGLKGSDGKPFVDCAVSRINNFDHFEENVGSVASRVARADGFVLDA